MKHAPQLKQFLRSADAYHLSARSLARGLHVEGAGGWQKESI